MRYPPHLTTATASTTASHIKPSIASATANDWFQPGTTASTTAKDGFQPGTTAITTAIAAYMSSTSAAASTN